MEQFRMAGPVNFRVLFGGEDDARKLTIQSLIPKSVEELTPEIKTFFGVAEDVRLQFKDVDFGNEFMNLLSISDIQDQSLAEEIIKYTAYPTDGQLEEVAGALVQTHPCLQEKGTGTGCCGWKHYIKIKMMNFRTKLGQAEHPEVIVNSLKNKRKGQDKAAANIKKPRKAEVNLEFMRITTVPLTSKFIGQLDRLTDDPIKVFCSKGGYAGQKIRTIMALTAKDNECAEAESGIAQTTMGIDAIRVEGASPEDEMYADVGVVLGGVEVLQNLQSITFASVMLYRLLYALNLSYPKDLKCTFEVFQKILMERDTNKLSSKVQALKIKMLQ
eukprot:superscaffoldBa00005660_g20634